jgi:uncharacterized membrane protein YeiH
MIANPTSDLLHSLYWITLIAVIVSSASSVLKAGFKKFDLFGVVIIAVATVSWGGSLLFIALLQANLDAALSAVIAGTGIFITRLLAIKFNISLLRFCFKS